MSEAKERLLDMLRRERYFQPRELIGVRNRLRTIERWAAIKALGHIETALVEGNLLIRKDEETWRARGVTVGEVVDMIREEKKRW